MSHIRLATLALAVVSVAVLSIGNASAGPLEEARQHYQRGNQHFQAGDYRAAIREFAAADRKAPAPVLNYNIALCHDRLGENGEAIRRYREYLRLVPSAQNRAEVEASIQRLEQTAKVKPAAPPPEEPPAAGAPAPDEPPQPEQPAAPSQPESSSAPVRRINAPAYQGTDPGLRRVSAIDIADIRARYFGDGSGGDDDFDPPPPR